MIRLIAFLAFSTLALASAMELHQRQLADHLLISADPVDQARSEYQAGNPDEAALLAGFAMDTATSDREHEAARVLLSEIDESRTAGAHARSFLSGALSGEPRDLAGFLGSLSLDLFVVGDIRDIVVQGYRQVSAGEGDTLILALSGIGLATTLSPQLDFAPALLKVFRRAGAFSERFVKSLNKASRNALRRGNFSDISRITTDFGSATRALGPAPMARIMKHVDDPLELSRLAKLARKDAPRAFGLTHLTGGKAIKSLKFGADAGTLAKAARRGSRLSKTFAKALYSVPDHVLTILFVVAGFAAAGILAGWMPRRKTRCSKPGPSSDDIPVLVHRVGHVMLPAA